MFGERLLRTAKTNIDLLIRPKSSFNLHLVSLELEVDAKTLTGLPVSLQIGIPELGESSCSPHAL